jgi:hypothetical protein
MSEQRNEPVDAGAVHDQDAEPTMTAPPEDRPDGGVASASGRDDSPDAVDADQSDEGEPQP